MPDFTSPSFQRPRYAVLVNILWFLSLAVALITASLGILVKQWFHELLSYKTHDPKERLKIRFFREAGLERWKVFAIASSLPLLLQLALLLFFVGLALFLLQQDAIVAWVTTGVMALWFAVFAFTVVMPMFASQCPYKIPMLNTFSHWARGLRSMAISRLYMLSEWVESQTSHYSRSRRLAKRLGDWLHRIQQSLDAFEEETMSKNPSLDAPVALYATADVLRGERLSDSLIECFTANEAVKAGDKMGSVTQNDSSNIPYMSFFGVYQVSSQAVEKFAFETFQDDRLRSSLLCQEADPHLLAMFYLGLTYLASKAYNPQKDLPISSQSLPAFIRMIQANPTSAEFSLITMYSIRHRTLTDHPTSFAYLFPSLSYSERHAHGIGKLTIPSLSPLQLIKYHRGPIPVEPPHSIKISHPFHLEPTTRRVL